MRGDQTSDLSTELVAMSEWFDLWRRGEVAMTEDGLEEFGRRLTDCAEASLHIPHAPMLEGAASSLIAFAAQGALHQHGLSGAAPQRESNVLDFPLYAQVRLLYPRLSQEPEAAQVLMAHHAELIRFDEIAARAEGSASGSASGGDAA